MKARAFGNSVQLGRQLLAAQALVVALDRSRLLALALRRRLFVELARPQLGQKAGLFDRALETAQCRFERLVLAYANAGHGITVVV